MSTVSSIEQVANMALSLVGVRDFIDSVDEDTTEAAVVKALWPTIRDRCLSDYHWPFATKRESLALLANETSQGWGYCYALPIACLVPRNIWPGTRNPGAGDSAPFALELQSTGGELMLCTDVADAELEYTHRAHPVLWPPHFAEAVAYALAVPLGAALRAQPGLLGSLEQMARLRLHAAAAVEQNKRQPDQRPDSEFITVR